MISPQKVKNEVDRLSKNLQKILYFDNRSKNLDFYISALTKYNPFYSTEEIEQWLKDLNSTQYFDVKQIPLKELDKWQFDQVTGDLKHESGGFFSIRGLRVKSNMGSISELSRMRLTSEWSQPIIYQPEIGILGIVTKKINGILYFLIQAKAEPGNINTYQLSPTVQATRSNYTRLHGGKPTPYLEYFFDGEKGRVLIDQLQSEQGARFFRKRNRNMIIEVPDNEKLEVKSNFRWLTLGQIQQLAQKNNIVNMDTRSIISEINFAPEKVTSVLSISSSKLKKILEQSSIITQPIDEFAFKLALSSHPNSKPLHTMEEVLQKVTEEKFKCILESNLIPLNQVERWKRTKHEIFHESQKYFSIIGVRIQASNREVSSWDQPIIKQKDSGIVGFITKEINGLLHFLVQLKMESGVMDLLELAPTVQCITDNYNPDDMPPFTDKFLNRRGFATIVDAHQSEEGGRFFQESNQNIVMLAKDTLPIKESSFYIWLSLGQLKELIKFNNFVNVEARSLLACLKMT